MLDFVHRHSAELLTVLWAGTAALTTLHVVLFKSEVRSAISWIGASWVIPGLGSALYLIFGVNRIERRARSLRYGLAEYQAPEVAKPVSADQMAERFDGSRLGSLAHLVDDVVKRPLLPGNALEPLIDGDEAYPAMIDAIDGAERSVSFATYIFDNDQWGGRFVDALVRAVDRGVEVRVLVDAAGLRYSFPSVYRRLRSEGIPSAKFLPSLFPPHLMAINLRNHRKIMVVDGQEAYTGGMNIRDGHVRDDEPESPIRDIHFRVEGPVVSHLQEVFVDDWNFSTGEDLRGEKWFPKLEPAGDVFARGIPDGPDEHHQKLEWTLHGALACARESVRIVTPYFLPDESLTPALNTAALRDIEVDVMMPEHSNLPFVQWASFGQMRPLLERGCRVWLTPPPFDHSKVMVVDEQWALVGSANWDPRSLRLNFEFNVECYDESLAAELDAWALERRASARRLTLDDLNGRSTGRLLRDNVARLASPYL